MSRSLARSLASILSALSLSLAAPDVVAQNRVDEGRPQPAAPTAAPAAPARPRASNRLAAATRQGASDEVVLPVTEVRARRVAAAERREARARRSMPWA